MAKGNPYRSTLRSNDNLKDDKSLKANQVYAARKVLLEHHGNTYIKLDRMHSQLEMLGLISIVLIPLIIGSMAWLFGQNILLLGAIAFFGAAGGTVSGIQFVARASTKDKIPDQLRSSWSILIRPLIGGISAFGCFDFLASRHFAGSVPFKLFASRNFICGRVFRTIFLECGR